MDGKAAGGSDGGERAIERRQPIVLALRVLIIGALLFAPAARAQELEPRSLTNLPVGTNFIVAAYGYSRGNVLLDPSLPIEDLQANIHAVLAAYVRTFSFFGMGSKVDVIVPFAAGDWSGALSGVDTTRSATGFGDPTVRLAVNFVGAPAMTRAELATRGPSSTVVGASVRATIPVGQYAKDRLLNLGANRWAFRIQSGISHSSGPWILEGHAAARFFTENSEFRGSSVTQRPLFSGMAHVIRATRSGLWLAISAGYASGGRPSIDGVARDFKLTTWRFAGTVAAPIAPGHTVKLVLASTKRIEEGPDFDAIAVSYQLRWGGR